VEIEGWYQLYGESVYRRCLRLCRDRSQALDLTQEVFLRAHRYRESYRGEATPLAWLSRLADRCFFDSIKRPPALALDEVLSFVASERDGAEREFVDHDLVLRLLSRSPEDVQAIVMHRYFDELELQAIARRLGLNERTVRRKLQRFLEHAEKLARSES
jgi:RNA polymerase sigma-70 factor (ECF subfamily)